MDSSPHSSTRRRTGRVRTVSEERVISSLRRLIGDAAVYLVGTAAVGAAGVLLVPLYTHYLAPETFGAYALIEAIVQLAVIVVTLGFNVAYLRWFAELPVGRRRQLFGATVLLVAVAAALSGTGLAVLTIAGVGSRVTGVEPHRYLWTIAPLILSGAVSNVLLTELRCQRRAVVFSVASLLRLVGTVGASLYTVAVLPGGVLGVLYGRLVGEGLAVVFLLAVTSRSLGVPGEWSELRGMVRYGLPIVASSLIITLLGVTGRYFLSWFSTMAEVGLFSVATKVAGIVGLLLVQPFGIAWGGLMFQIAREPDAKRVYALIWSATWLLGWGIVGGIGLLTPELFGVFTAPAYACAQAAFPWLLASQLLILMQYPAAIGIYLEKRTGLLSLLYVAGLVVNIGSGVALVMWFGSAGAAAAWCLANVAITAATWLTNQRLYPLSWNPVRFAVVAAVGVLLLSVGVSFAGRPWGIGGALRLVGAIGTCAVTIALLMREVGWLRSRHPGNAAVPGT
jgi:O-antigen/teichoic acid export membrane protein